MAEENTTAERVRAVVARVTGKPIEQITDDATFEALEADSLDVVETLIEIDLEFDGAAVDDEKFTMASTIGDLIKETEAVINVKG